MIAREVVSPIGGSVNEGTFIPSFLSHPTTPTSLAIWIRGLVTEKVMEAVGFGFEISSNTFWKVGFCFGHVVHVGGVRVIRNCRPWHCVRLTGLSNRGFTGRAM